MQQRDIRSFFLQDRTKWTDQALFEWETTSKNQKRYITYLLQQHSKGSNKCNSSLLYILGLTDQEPCDSVQRLGGSGLCDFDCDFDELERDQVISYLTQKFGEKNVARIGTFGRMKARAAIRAVARTLNYPYETGDKLASLILPPVAGRVQNLKTCYEKVEELNLFRKQTTTPEGIILQWAERFEDRLQSFGTHASGVIISSSPVFQTVPLALGKEEQPTTQWEMYAVEKAGLVKFDLLGLRVLTTIKHCISLIQQRHNRKVDIHNIPIDDSEVYQQLARGDTTGIFQVEGSSGIGDLLVRLKPTCLDDLSLLVAIYRPGPLASGMVDQLIQVRNKEVEATYLIPQLEPILQPTGGMIVYQEQVLEICKQLAGYSLGEADMMRRAIGKKKPEEMAKQREKFLTGMISHKFTEKQALELFNQIEAFADYSFNRCLPGNTLVKTIDSDKSINKIQQDLQLHKKIYTLAFNINNQSFYKDECVEIIDCGDQDFYLVTFDDGTTLECTLDHQFLCEDMIKHTLREILLLNLAILAM